MAHRDKRVPESAADAELVFGDCKLTSDGRLRTPGGTLQLSKRVSNILRALIEAEGIAVSSAFLIDLGWGVGSGGPQGLTKAIFRLRRALAGSQTVCIESAYGYGYRLHCEPAGTRQLDRRIRAQAICQEAALRIHERRDINLNAAKFMYQQAAELDPGCIAALVGYATAAMHLMASGWESGVHEWPAARQTIGEALQFAPNHPEALAYRALGECMVDWNFETARSTFDLALNLAPASFVVQELAGRMSLFCGETDQALHHLDLALAANPMSASTHGLMAYALALSGDVAAAFAQLDHLRSIDPASVVLPTYTCWIEAMFRDPEAACRVLLGHSNITTQDTTLTIAVRANALARAGRRSTARALLDTIDRQRPNSTARCALAAHAWMAVDEPAAAVDELAKAAETRDYWTGTVLHYPLSSTLLEQPGFDRIYATVFGSASRIPSGAKPREASAPTFGTRREKSHLDAIE